MPGARQCNFVVPDYILPGFQGLPGKIGQKLSRRLRWYGVAEMIQVVVIMIHASGRFLGFPSFLPEKIENPARCRYNLQTFDAGLLNAARQHGNRIMQSDPESTPEPTP